MTTSDEFVKKLFSALQCNIGGEPVAFYKACNSCGFITHYWTKEEYILKGSPSFCWDCLDKGKGITIFSDQ